MTLWRLIRKEIGHRPLNFFLGILSALVAVGALTAQLTMLDAHDLRTEQIIEAKRSATKERLDKMEDDYRKVMKKLGFNLLILPENLDLAEFYHRGYATLDMPEEYVDKLANSGIMTVRHLLPSLEQEILWAERDRKKITLIGARGEVPLAHRSPQEPLMDMITTGSAILGHEIWSSLNLKLGDPITILGMKFQVATCNEERGTKDDVSIWVNLAQAQELLKRPGRINAILALKCFCANNELAQIRKSIAETLPGVRVQEIDSRVVVRAEARELAEKEAIAAIAAEEAQRDALRAERQALADWLIPLVLFVAVAWIGLLALTNVRERATEIGVLRAIGLRSSQILTVFLVRAALVGVLGALAGYALGFGLGVHFSDLGNAAQADATLYNPTLLVLALVGAPLLAVLAAWPPALMAARQDPAIVLRKD